MDNNVNTTGSEPAPAVTPDIGATPPQPSVQTPPPVQPSYMSQPKKPLVAIILGIVAALLVVAGGLFFFLNIFPDMQVKSTADKFVGLVVDGDYDEALKLTDNEEGEDAKRGAESLMKALDTQLADKDYKLVSLKTSNDTKRVKYELSDDSSKYFTVALKHVDGSWKVTELIINLGQSSGDETTGSTKTETPTPVATACLPAASLEKHWRYKSGWEFYFHPDTNKVVYESVAVTDVEQMVEFYNDNKQYNFVFTIDVSMYQADQSSSAAQDLALLRASVVAHNMNLRGVPYSVMRLGKVTFDGGDPTRPEYALGYRSAYVSINSSCDAQSTPENLKKDIDKSYGI